MYRSFLNMTTKYITGIYMCLDFRLLYINIIYNIILFLLCTYNSIRYRYLYIILSISMNLINF